MSSKILVFNVIFRYRQDNNLNEMGKYTYIERPQLSTTSLHKTKQILIECLNKYSVKYCVYYILKFYVYYILNINFCGF